MAKNKMTLEDYIKKYGEIKGPKKFLEVYKRIKTRMEIYKKLPYKVLTKEWFIWKYPEDGLQRFNDHVNKSRQSEENMINRWGEVEGKKKWQQTVEKKNTRKIVREKYGEEAALDIERRKKETYWKNLEKLSELEKEQRFKKRSEAKSKSYREKYGNKTKLQIYIDKYGNELGPIKYATFLQKIFKSVGHSNEAYLVFKELLNKEPGLLKYDLYYRDPTDSSKKEFFIANKEVILFYDFCIPELKAIIEYDGSMWHPTLEESLLYGNKLMPVTNISYREKYLKDLYKIQIAEEKDFKVFKIRSDMTTTDKNIVINNFISYVKYKENTKETQDV